MIEVNGLTKTFGNLKAVDNLSVAFEPGVTGLVGHNGAGKSTLLRCIAGVFEPNGGEAKVNGNLSNTKQAKTDLFFLPDDPFAPMGANIKETFNFYSGLFEFDKEKFNSLVETFGLPKNKAVRTFSKGMKRQLFVALALSAKADNLLLDEAFDGLDPMVVDVIKGEIIECASQNKTIVVSSHNILALERLADRFVVLNKGQVAKQGSQEDIGVEFVKYQAAFKFKANEQNIADLGYEVVSFRSVGSVSHFVIYEAPGALEHIKEKLDPLFIEQVPFEPDEVLTLEMLAAKKKEGGENA